MGRAVDATIRERSVDPGWLSNAYLVGGPDGGTALLIDSGAPLEPLFDALERGRLRLAAVLSTHRHGDHTGGNAEIVRRTGAPVFALRPETAYIPGSDPLEDGEERVFGGLMARAVALPGHTTGHCGYLVEGVGLFTGDCLFKGSLGGTVLPASSGFEDARRAVERILALPDATPLHPGHAGPTTVGRERVENPFIRVMTGLDREGDGRCRALGRPARLVVHARDYDGGTKAWVRFDDDGRDALVPGSRVEVEARGR
jgi:glyoxylase-like metal-dependent hydrolase (beta-lactamase superfamily II)